MNYANIIELIEHILVIIQIILYACGLSLLINATHIAFQKEMVLNWLYEWLESKFRVHELLVTIKDISIKNEWYLYDECDNSFYTFFRFNMYKRINDKGGFKYYINDKLIDKETILYQDKYIGWRNSKGLLYIAKPIYACASCMPSLWSLPLLVKLVWWKVFFIAIFAVVISTLLRDKLFENE